MAKKTSVPRTRTQPLNLSEEALRVKWEPSVMNHVRISQWSRGAAHFRKRDDSDAPARAPTLHEQTLTGAPNGGLDVDTRSDEDVVKDEIIYHKKLTKRNVSRASFMVSGLQQGQLMIERLSPHHLTEGDTFPAVALSREATLLSSSIPPSLRFTLANAPLLTQAGLRPHRIAWHDRNLASRDEYVLDGDITDHACGFRVLMSPPALSTPATGVVHISLNVRCWIRPPYIKVTHPAPGRRPARSLASFIIAPAAYSTTVLAFALVGGASGQELLTMVN